MGTNVDITGMMTTIGGQEHLKAMVPNPLSQNPLATEKLVGYNVSTILKSWIR